MMLTIFKWHSINKKPPKKVQKDSVSMNGTTIQFWLWRQIINMILKFHSSQSMRWFPWQSLLMLQSFIIRKMEVQEIRFVKRFPSYIWLYFWQNIPKWQRVSVMNLMTKWIQYYKALNFFAVFCYFKN